MPYKIAFRYGLSTTCRERDVCIHVCLACVLYSKLALTQESGLSCGFLSTVGLLLMPWLSADFRRVPYNPFVQPGNDKSWRDCVGRRSCKSHAGCWKVGGRELNTREWSLANQPPAIYIILPLCQNHPLPLALQQSWILGQWLFSYSADSLWPNYTISTQGAL
jgi:hypothetical protein